MIKKIKSTLKKIILKNGYLLNLYNKRKQNKEEKELNKRNTAIKKHGEECLILLQDLLKNTNRMYFFDMGNDNIAIVKGSDTACEINLS